MNTHSDSGGWEDELHKAPFYQRATPSGQACMDVFFEHVFATAKQEGVREERERIRGNIEKLLEPREDADYWLGYNDALDDLLSKLN